MRVGGSVVRRENGRRRGDGGREGRRGRGKGIVD